jgi:hypothetical protein
MLKKTYLDAKDKAKHYDGIGHVIAYQEKSIKDYYGPDPSQNSQKSCKICVY